MTLPFAITNWSAWAPGYDTLDKWECLKQPELELDRDTVPAVKDLPMMLRRRLSRLGRMALRVALDAGCDKGARLVFSSRYGEAAQTVGLLENLSKNEGMSPTIFSMSVHNALAGLLSIHHKNNHSHTAIAAGAESFCSAMMEAAALLVEDPETPVLLVHYDEPLPEYYQPHVDETVPSLALALVLNTMPSSETGVDFGFSPTPLNAQGDKSDVALSFIHFLANNEKSWNWSAEYKNWWCTHHVA